jgi:hypothetical protein
MWWFVALGLIFALPSISEVKKVGVMRSFLRQFSTFGAALVAFFVVSPIHAAELAKPTGPVILTISGKITQTNGDGKAQFDRAMLEALGVSTLKTGHSWADGVTTFEGVNAAKILDAAGVTGTKIRAIALNDYAIDLEVAELRKYPVLFALKSNGADLHRRDRGPIWIVYPRDQFSEFKDERHNFKWIWQLKGLEIQ